MAQRVLCQIKRKADAVAGEISFAVQRLAAAPAHVHPPLGVPADGKFLEIETCFSVDPDQQIEIFFGPDPRSGEEAEVRVVPGADMQATNMRRVTEVISEPMLTTSGRCAGLRFAPVPVLLVAQ